MDQQNEQIQVDEPIYVTMEALLAEEGMDVRAGLPEELRQDIERREALRKRAEQAKQSRERIERIFAAILEHEARIAELQKELVDAMRDYAAAVLGSPTVV